jgi:hypothetical protein
MSVFLSQFLPTSIGDLKISCLLKVSNYRTSLIYWWENSWWVELGIRKSSYRQLTTNISYWKNNYRSPSTDKNEHHEHVDSLHLEQATHLVPESEDDVSMDVPWAILINWRKHEYCRCNDNYEEIIESKPKWQQIR